MILGSKTNFSGFLKLLVGCSDDDDGWMNGGLCRSLRVWRLTPPWRSVYICQSVMSCHSAPFWHSQKTPKGVWLPGSDQWAQDIFLFSTTSKKAAILPKIRTVYLYLMSPGEESEEENKMNEWTQLLSSFIWIHLQCVPAVCTCSVYLLCDVAFVMNGCQITKDEFGSFGLSWSTLSTVTTKSVNLRVRTSHFFSCFINKLIRTEIRFVN